MQNPRNIVAEPDNVTRLSWVTLADGRRFKVTEIQRNRTAAIKVDTGRTQIQPAAFEPTKAEYAELPIPSRNVLLASVWKLARQPYYWSPERFTRMLWTMASNVPTQLRILRVLSRPSYRRLVAVDPRFPLKCMALEYLARGLTIKQQAECFMHHYRRLPDVLPEGVLTRILLGEILLEELHTGDHRFTIWMGLSRPWDDEGELSLNLEVDGKVVFVLSFTIIPGWVVGSMTDEVMLISRVQGVRGCYEEIQLATKSLHDIAPPALLFAALCGIAEVYGVHGMAGITATMKPEFHFYEGEAAHIQEAYDGFFAELGATKGPTDFYLCPLPPPEKPMILIKRGHKTRTRTKRAFKRQIALSVCQSLFEICKE